MNLSRLRLITFDVTDTLLRFRASPGRQYNEVGALYGIICDNKSLSNNFKSHWRRMNHEHPNFGLQTGLDWEDWWKEIVFATFRDSEVNLDEKKLGLIASHLINLYEGSLCWQLSHGAMGLLSLLRSKPIPLGVISNFDPRLENILHNTKLRHYFNFIVGSYEVGVAKPHPDIFNKAIEVSQVKDLQPEQCLHIGDSASLDYNGARNSGWNAILLSKQQRSAVNQQYPYVDVEHVYSSLFEVHRNFVEMNNLKLSARQ